MFICSFFISFIPLLLCAFILQNSLRDYFKETNEKDLLYQANKIAVSIQKNDYLTRTDRRRLFTNELDEKSYEENYRVIVVDNLGFAVADTNRSALGKMCIIPEILVALDGKDAANFRNDEGTIYASAFIENDHSEIIGAVLIISSFDEVYTLLDGISRKWVIATAVISLAILAMVYFLMSILLTPLKNILNTIELISAGQLHNRVEIKGRNEFSQLAKEINTMTQQLEQVDSARQEFVSNVSHELKTPLSSIKVLSESILLQEDMPTEMYREFLQDINSEVDRMTNIINDLLSLVKMDYKEAAIIIEETDLCQLLTEIMKRLKPLSDKKNITLSLEIVREMVIEADAVKINLALSNLVENAIKYTPEGGEVTVTLDGDHQNSFITVEDTGIGISEEEQSKIFNRFYRVDKTRDRETGGTGLGLAITHSAVILHNGSIKVDSALGEGSTFIIRLPIKYQGAAVEKTAKGGAKND